MTRNKNTKKGTVTKLKRAKTFFAVAGLFCLLTMTVGAETPRTYEVARTRVPIKIDGKLNEEAWTKVPEVGNFVNNVDDSTSPVKTEARLLYDENFLYVSFRCVDDNIWATMKRRDEHLWLEEVVEFFVQADEQKPSYIEVEVNPLGTLLDLYMLDVRKPLHYESWNSEKIRWAVQVNGTVDGKGGDKEWTVEIALPMEDVVTAPHLPPQPGDRWRLNLYRVEQRPVSSELAWSPTLQNDFHVPKRFGEIVFSSRVVP